MASFWAKKISLFFASPALLVLLALPSCNPNQKSHDTMDGYGVNGIKNLPKIMFECSDQNRTASGLQPVVSSFNDTMSLLSGRGISEPSKLPRTVRLGPEGKPVTATILWEEPDSSSKHSLQICYNQRSVLELEWRYSDDLLASSRELSYLSLKQDESIAIGPKDLNRNRIISINLQQNQEFILEHRFSGKPLFQYDFLNTSRPSLNEFSVGMIRAIRKPQSKDVWYSQIAQRGATEELQSPFTQILDSFYSVARENFMNQSGAYLYWAPHHWFLKPTLAGLCNETSSFEENSDPAWCAGRLFPDGSPMIQSEIDQTWSSFRTEVSVLRAEELKRVEMSQNERCRNF